MSKYTKGPWKIDVVTQPNGSETKYVIGKIGGVEIGICKMFFMSTVTKQEREANALLISKAPEMYEALKDVAKYSFPKWLTAQIEQAIKEVE